MKNYKYPHCLVPLDISKKLRNIGFDLPCVFVLTNKGRIGFTTRENNEYHLFEELNLNSNSENSLVCIPTWTQAFDWFMTQGIPSHIEWVEEGRFKFVYRTDKTCGKVEWLSFEYSNLLEAREGGLKKLIQHYKEIMNIINVDNKTKGIFPVTPKDCFKKYNIKAIKIKEKW